MDSMDNYLTLLDLLSSALRQGWLHLADARHSMGASRINGALLDHKLHSAATSVKVKQQEAAALYLAQMPLDDGKCRSQEHKYSEDKLQGKSGALQLQNCGNPQFSGVKSSDNGTPLDINDQAQKERAKSLSMFGTVVSQKLRAAQLSFETALETNVEIANMHSAMLSSFDLVHRELEVNKRTA